MNRAGFGLSPDDWKNIAPLSHEKVLGHLFQGGVAGNQHFKTEFAGLPDSPRELNRMSKEEKEGLKKQAKKNIAQINYDWIREMAFNQEASLLNRMSLFWHGHFACQTKLIPKLAAGQLNTIRQHALGNFRDLVLAIARDPSMILFLNNQQNKKRQPNENFARELMELFTIGRDQYTEKDIKEAARAFTGWSIKLNGDYYFNTRQHDFGTKQFMGRTGNFNGEDIIDILLEQKQTAYFITSKIYRYFVNEKLNADRVASLANYFYRNNYDIKKLMWKIFSSDWFYYPENVGNKIKSPIDLIAGMMKNLAASFDTPFPIIQVQRALGQQLFNPPNVAGWKGGQTWIDNSTLMTRLHLSQYLLNMAEVELHSKKDPESSGNARPFKLKWLKAKVNLQPLYELIDHQNKNSVIKGLAQYLVPSANIDSSLILPYTSQNKGKANFVESVIMRLMSLPEYQLC